MYKDNMECRLCTSGENETQEHLKKCKFKKDMRKNLDLEIRDGKIVFWRKVTRALKEIYEPKTNVNKLIINIIDKAPNEIMRAHRTQQGQVKLYPHPARKLVIGVVRVM